jgi:hypothetical protein
MKGKLNNCVFIALCPLTQSFQNKTVTLWTDTKQEDADKSASTLKKDFFYRSFVEWRCIVLWLAFICSEFALVWKYKLHSRFKHEHYHMHLFRNPPFCASTVSWCRCQNPPSCSSHLLSYPTFLFLFLLAGQPFILQLRPLGQDLWYKGRISKGSKIMKIHAIENHTLGHF